MACRVLAQTVPGATTPVLLGPGGTVGAAAVPPYQFSVQLPDCAAVPNGSTVVFATVTPVSKPAWLVTYGYNKTVRQIAIVKMFVGVVPIPKRGITPVEAAPEVNVGAELWGAWGVTTGRGGGGGR